MSGHNEGTDMQGLNVCLKCGAEYEMYAPSKTRKYCYACRMELFGKSEGRIPTYKHAISGLLSENLNWFNAGLFCGSQGYLRDRFQSLLESGKDFLEAKAEIETDPKWQAERKGLSKEQACSWLIGFFVSFNRSMKGRYEK